MRRVNSTLVSIAPPALADPHVTRILNVTTYDTGMDTQTDRKPEVVMAAIHIMAQILDVC
ncbi:MAG: hypothetical protein M3P08_14145 [Thermoproteota archaeon]|nr:hypothetical protein [Thermoproteota archaeon]